LRSRPPAPPCSDNARCPIGWRASSLLAPAPLAGLVIFEAFSGSQSHHIVLDARAVGLLVAVVGKLLGLPLPVILVLAAAATALTRL
jgi:hypothetical protein